jgi:hypothetical protein
MEPASRPLPCRAGSTGRRAGSRECGVAAERDRLDADVVRLWQTNVQRRGEERRGEERRGEDAARLIHNSLTVTPP